MTTPDQPTPPAASDPPLPPAALRVAAAAEALGLAIRIVEMPGSTRTAEDAARACGCALGQIVKSLVFAGGTSGKPYLLLVSGANRVDEAVVSAVIGEPIVRPGADQVRAWTGFAIGGIPPFGHAEPMRTVIDPDLLGFSQVWAAAGTPKTVFAVAPADLARVTGAQVVAMG